MIIRQSVLHRLALVALALSLLGVAGCRDRDIRSYRTPKEAEDNTVSGPAAPAPEAVAKPPAAPKWTAPASWQRQAASGMRLASFSATDASGTADISVVNFGGTGGDELANVNRWRGQLKLDPIAADALPTQVQKLSTPSGDYSVADMTAGQGSEGKPPMRILGAWLRRNNMVWFIKMMGPAGLVGSQRAAFTGFLESIEFGDSVAAKEEVLAGGPAPAPANTNDLPRAKSVSPELVAPSPSATLPGGTPLKSADGSSLVWHAPASWAVRQASSMRKGSYALGPDGGVDLAVTAFPGDVGGPLANVNRWLGQVGLPPIEEPALADYTSHIQANGLVFFIADTGAKDPAHPQRIVSAVVFWQGNSWFFKMTGPTELVAKEKPGFLEFLQSVRAP